MRRPVAASENGEQSALTGDGVSERTGRIYE